MTDAKLLLLESMLSRSEKLVSELEAVYTQDLKNKSVSAEALNITHEIVEKCANVLDQGMTIFFEEKIAHLLTARPKRGGYFPAAQDEHSYLSMMGQWKAKDIGEIAPELDALLRSLQPFSNPSNEIYARIRGLASMKHTALEPQIRKEERRVNVRRGNEGGVSWGSGVRFGAGVKVLSVPIDPATQMPAHTKGIDVTEEKWVSFHFSDNGEDALAFCKQAVLATRSAIKRLFS